jgi:hypothetical protein
MSDRQEKDFFVSYTQADEAWAEWIAWELEEAGYSVKMQDWDFLPGGTSSMRCSVGLSSRLARLQSCHLHTCNQFSAHPNGRGCSSRTRTARRGY